MRPTGALSAHGVDDGVVLADDLPAGVGISANDLSVGGFAVSVGGRQCS